MTIFNWIFIGLLVINTGFLVLSYIKNIEIMKKICCVLLFPLSLVHPPYLLLQFTPDSYHTIFLSVLALFLTTVSIILFVFSSIKFIKGLAYFILFASFLTWGELFRTIFYVYKLPQWCTILLIAVNAIILLASQIASGKKTIPEYFCTSIFIAGAEFLNVLALINLIYVQNTSSILFFTGTMQNFILVIFDLIDAKKFNLKQGMLIRTLSLTTSQFMIAFSCLLIFN